MPSRVVNVFIAIAAFLAFVLCTGAQSRSARGTEHRLNADTAQRPEKPFDVSVNRVKLGSTNSPIAIYQALSGTKQLQPKSEFETTKAFLERSRIQPDDHLNGELNFNSTIALVVNPDSDEGVYGTYYADESELKVMLFAETFRPEGSNEWFDRVRLSTIHDHESHYEASNAFGASIGVVKDESAVVDALVEAGTWTFPDKSLLRYTANNTDASDQVSFKITPDQARTAKKQGRLLLIGQLERPWLVHYQESHAPTYSAPLDEHIDHNDFYFRVDAVWLVDALTGEVYGKATDPSSETTIPH